MAEYLFVIIQQPFDNAVDFDRTAVGELPVVDPGEEQQGFIQPDDVVQCMLGFEQFFHLFLRQFRIVEQPFDAVVTNGERCLEFVRCIADELLLLFE